MQILLALNLLHTTIAADYYIMRRKHASYSDNSNTVHGGRDSVRGLWRTCSARYSFAKGVANLGEGGVLSVDTRSGSATDNIGNWATDL